MSNKRRNHRGIAARTTRQGGAAAAFGLVMFAFGLAQAQAPQVPLPALPPVPAQPGMLVGPSALPQLRARRTDPAYQPWFDAFRRFVDGRLATIATVHNDDVLARFAKAAAMLEFLGESPPAGSPYGRYRDAAAEAIANMATRTPNVFPGSGSLQPQYDASTLQCMAEAFDLLRASGLSRNQEQTLRARISAWAGAVAADLPLSVAPNNIMAKAGAGLVSAALALPGEAGARSWLQTGTDYVNRALADKLSAEGWWREGPHYANYTLDNLISAAWHVRNRTGLDWFAALGPMVRYALDAQLPDGRLAPYEDGVSVSFPFHTLIAAYPGDPIQAEMMRAWRRGQPLLGSYLNQQQHDVSAFCLFDAGVQPAAWPSGAPMTVLAGDTNLVVLRSGFDRDAVYVSVMSARDYSLLDLWPSRHNLANPLDLVLYARGATLLPTSGGGPLVTRSPNRAHYLDPRSNHTILVNGRAPFVSSAAQIEITDRLDDEAGAYVPTAYVDAATTSMRGAYQNAEQVERTIALVDGRYVIVADEVRARTPVEVRTPWRGRGARKLGLEAPGMIATRWSFNGTSLEHATACATGTLTRVLTTGYYAETWNHEETIAGIEIATRGDEVRLLHLLEPHAANDAPRTVIERSGPAVACLEVQGRAGERDWIAFGRAGGGYTLGPLGANGRLVFVRADGQGVQRLALIDGTEVRWQGRAVLQLSRAASCVLDAAADHARVRFAADTPFAPITVRIDGLAALDPGRVYAAVHNGVRLDDALVQRDGTAIVVRDVPGGGVLVIGPATSLGGGNGTGNGTGSGGASTAGGGSHRGGGGGGCVFAHRSAPGAALGWWLLAALAIGIALRSRPALRG